MEHRNRKRKLRAEFAEFEREGSLMQQDLEQKLPCRSVFKDGRAVTSVNAYTKAWITLINLTERNKNSDFGAKNDKNLVV